jgi:hypothetical protein
MTDRIVICMKWGTLYGPVYVNTLFCACRHHLQGPFRFVCLTDDATGFLPGIEALPIPDMGIDRSYFRAGAWPKVSLFKPDLHGLKGRMLFIDLDMMIVGPLDPFFETTAPLNATGPTTWPPGRRPAKPPGYHTWKALRRTMRGQKPQPAAAPPAPAPATALATGSAPSAAPDPDAFRVGPNTLGTQIFAFDAGSLGHVYDRFVARPALARATYQHEQHYVEYQLDRWEPWPQGWVASFKHNLRQPLITDLFREPTRPDGSTPVIAFHGEPRPIDLATSRFSSRDEFPHMWRGPVSWVREYFDRFGG